MNSRLNHACPTPPGLHVKYIRGGKNSSIRPEERLLSVMVVKTFSGNCVHSSRKMTS